MSLGLRPRAPRDQPPAVLRLIAPAVWQPERLVPLPHLPKQAGEVGQVLGNKVDDLALPLHPSATSNHARRQNEPALFLEQRGPDDQVRNVRFVFQRDEQDPIGRARPLADKHEPRDGHTAAVRRSAEAGGRHVAASSTRSSSSSGRNNPRRSSAAANSGSGSPPSARTSHKASRRVSPSEPNASASAKRFKAATGTPPRHRSYRRALQPSALAECRKINSGRRIPSQRAIAGAKLQGDVLVAIRNP